MFKKIFTELCNEKGVAPTKACTDNGLSNAAYSCWTEDTVPRQATLFKFAKYFNVSVDYLLGKEKKPTAEVVGQDDQLLEEAEQLMGTLSPARQEEALRYLRYLASQEGKDMP